MAGPVAGFELRLENIPLRVQETFWDKVQRGPGCWLWARARSPAGYGIVGWKGAGGPETHIAHRVAYALVHGVTPAGLVVCSTCRIRACVRPDHLQVSTHADNVRRALTRHTRDGMSMVLAREIRDLLIDGIPDRDIADRYGLALPRVRALRLNQIWMDPTYTPIRRRGRVPAR